MMTTQFLLVLLASLLCLGAATECNYQNFGGSSDVCACSVSLGCDTVTPVGDLSLSELAVYTTSKTGNNRLTRSTVSFEQEEEKKRNIFDDIANEVFGGDEGDLVIAINSTTYQSMIGFGGALTDAAAIDIFQMSKDVQNLILESYYADDGIQYTIGRLPIAGCDFSTYAYSYDDSPNDLALTNFSVDVDLTTKLPLTWMVQNISKIKLFSSPWSAPAWMKTNGKFVGGSLIGEAGDKYHKAWAQYFVKYLDAYKGYGIDIWGVTAQNEPTATVTWNSMVWTAEQQRDWIKTDLGPALAESGYGDIDVIILDDQRWVANSWVTTVLSDPDANQYVAGTGVHWYTPSAYSALTSIHDKFPDKFILATEACEGYIPLPGNHVKLGDWSRAESYVSDMIDDIFNYAAGWTDWNIVLDLQGGPNWAKNYVDSPIIANTTSGDIFYKQPMFYAMGHFSKFVRPNSVRMGISVLSGSAPSSFRALSFRTEDNMNVIVVQNTGRNDVKFEVKVEGRGTATINSPSHSFQTLLYREQ